MVVKHPFPFLVALWLAMPAQAGNADLAGLIADCDACHGAGGVSRHGDVPSIAGKEHVLLERALKQFRNMERPCRRTAYRDGDPAPARTTMCEVTANLDDAQIRALSQHYAALPFVPAPQDFDPELAVQGAALHSLYCESCHPKGGSEAGYAGRLAGQWTPYLRRAVDEICTSQLIVPHMMERKVSEFSPSEIEALLNFWASQQE
jgi:sulfide dehydrogenase cytochrome subunit